MVLDLRGCAGGASGSHASSIDAAAMAGTARFMSYETHAPRARARGVHFFFVRPVMLVGGFGASQKDVRTTIATLFLISLTAGCGSTSPEGFIRAQARIGCRTLKRCDKFAWTQSEYGSVGACMDEQLDGFVDDFVDACDDFDSAAARKCLSGMRAVRRSCDPEAASRDQEDACSEVCGRFRSWTESDLHEALAGIEPAQTRQRRVFASQAAKWLDFE
jgi:hypothetical protein